MCERIVNIQDLFSSKNYPGKITITSQNTFYINGTFIGEGTRKPSQMQPVCNYVELEVRDFIPFRELEQTL
jgi:hypothetical protein